MQQPPCLAKAIGSFWERENLFVFNKCCPIYVGYNLVEGHTHTFKSIRESHTVLDGFKKEHKSWVGREGKVDLGGITVGG